MNLEQIVKETVAKIVAEKTLTAAEEKKREEIVMAMKKDFKGPAPAMYAIATDKAKKLAEEGDHEVSMAQNSLNSIIRSAMELKAKIGDQEINIPAWIQDHITNSENFIDQASQGYHEYENGGHEEMDEANLGHNETSSISQEGQYWVVTYSTADGTKEKAFKSEDEAREFYNTLDEAFQPKSSFDDYSVGDNVTVAGKKAKITNMEMDDETGERRARVKFEDGSVEKVSINSLDEAQDISDNELAQLQATADDTSKMPAERDAARNKIYASRAKKESQELDEVKHPMFDKLVKQYISKGYSEENAKKQAAADINAGDKSGERSEKSAFNYNESQELDEFVIRRWQHYAGIK